MSLALINGKIYTLDDNNSIAEAIAISNNLITIVGSSEDVLSPGNDHQQVIDLHGKTVFPGFFDSHTHLGQLALESLWASMHNTTAKEQVLEILEKRIKVIPAGNWVVGVGYDDTTWDENENITKLDLDELSTAHPIFLRRECGHIAVVNSLALEHIDKTWKYVDRDTGMLIEDAVLGFMKIIKPDQSVRLEGTKRMLKKLHTLGITAVREIVNPHSIEVYRELDGRSELNLRVFGYIIVEDLDDHLKSYPSGAVVGNNFKVVGVKIFLDGSMGARTAALKEPYSDDPKNYGKLLYSNSELKEIFQRVRYLDLSLMVHAIGDAAIQQFLDIYREIFDDQVPENPKGHTLEHVEVLDAELIKVIKTLGICVSVQPNFAGRWSIPSGLNEQRLGQDRLKMCNPYNSLIKNNIPVIFGSDSMPLGPIFGLQSAIFHPIKDQRISAIDAIKAYTKNSCSILNLTSKLGSIIPGKVADLIVLSHDPLHTNESDFNEIKVLGTIFNGELVNSTGLDININQN